jgi:hypothetical protein
VADAATVGPAIVVAYIKALADGLRGVRKAWRGFAGL